MFCTAIEITLPQPMLCSLANLKLSGARTLAGKSTNLANDVTSKTICINQSRIIRIM